jgi:hypothetical protein
VISCRVAQAAVSGSFSGNPALFPRAEVFGPPKPERLPIRVSNLRGNLGAGGGPGVMRRRTKGRGRPSLAATVLRHQSSASLFRFDQPYLGGADLLACRTLCPDCKRHSNPQNAGGGTRQSSEARCYMLSTEFSHRGEITCAPPPLSVSSYLLAGGGIWFQVLDRIFQVDPSSTSIARYMPATCLLAPPF